MPSFFTPDLDRDAKTLGIDGDEFHHLVRVFRKKRGENIELTNGKGVTAQAVISDIGNKKLTVDINETKEFEQQIPVIAVAFSLLRNKNDHVLVEKLTELGVAFLFPYTCEHSVRNVSRNTVDKFRKVSVAAVKQCNNPFLPAIAEVQDFPEAMDTLQDQGYLVLTAAEREADLYLTKVIPKPLPHKICIVIGPEGGFSDSELAYIRSKDIDCYTLGKNVLRAETAAITAVAQLILVINDITG
jgi:16S rRNA (uracil1498-N3)-methyltransferase